MEIKRMILLLLCFLSACSNEYVDFHAEKMTSKAHLLQSQSQLFSPDEIEHRDVELIATPDKKVLDRFVAIIDGAKERVYLETYILTEKRLLHALKNASRRWVDVRVILEKSVFGAPNINKKAYDALSSSGVQVVYSDPKFVFTHSKFLIIDQSYIIGTGNMSYSSFTQNREFFVLGNNPHDLAELLSIFMADYSKKSVLLNNSHLFVSPVNSRKKLETLLSSAKKSIHMYAQTLSDERVISLLQEKASEGVDVRICLGNLQKISRNREVYELLERSHIPVGAPKKPYVHAKAFVIDGAHLAVGSVNFTTNSLDSNREVGIIFRNPQSVEIFFRLFRSDCPAQ